MKKTVILFVALLAAVAHAQLPAVELAAGMHLIRAEVADPTTAVVLFDVVLGYGSAADPTVGHQDAGHPGVLAELAAAALEQDQRRNTGARGPGGLPVPRFRPAPSRRRGPACVG